MSKKIKLKPTFGRVYCTKGLGFCRMKVVDSEYDSVEKETVYILEGERFSWKGNANQFHEDFNGDIKESIL